MNIEKLVEKLSREAGITVQEAWARIAKS